MREIKFRAWDPKEKKWAMNNTNIAGLMMFGNTLGGMVEKIFKRLIWLEYTGLKDKNSKEIFEGDIVKNDDIRYKDQNDISRGTVGQIVFDMCVFEGYYAVMGWTVKNDEWDCIFIQSETGKNYEVIGNIYENPDLLKD